MSISRFKIYRNHGKRNTQCCLAETEQPVREGLAYSVADVARLTDRGLPVNSLNTGKAFIDGSENPSFHITSDRERYVDVADLWEQHMNIRDKARAAARAKRSTSKSS